MVRIQHNRVAGQPILDDKDAASIDREYSMRMRSLLSVDDMILDLHKVLSSTPSSSSGESGDTEWARTYVIFSSDVSPLWLTCCLSVNR